MAAAARSAALSQTIKPVKDSNTCQIIYFRSKQCKTCIAIRSKAATVPVARYILFLTVLLAGVLKILAGAGAETLFLTNDRTDSNQRKQARMSYY